MIWHVVFFLVRINFSTPNRLRQIFRVFFFISIKIECININIKFILHFYSFLAVYTCFIEWNETEKSISFFLIHDFQSQFPNQFTLNIKKVRAKLQRNEENESKKLYLTECWKPSLNFWQVQKRLRCAKLNKNR